MWKKITDSITIKDFIYIFIIVGISVFFWLHKGPSRQDITAQEYKIDSLSHVNQIKLDSIAKYYALKFDSVSMKIDTAYKAISNNDKKITDLEKTHEKQNHVIDSYDADQLEHVLSNY